MTRENPVPPEDLERICALRAQGLGARRISHIFDDAYHPSRVSRLFRKCPEAMGSAVGNPGTSAPIKVEPRKPRLAPASNQRSLQTRISASSANPATPSEHAPFSNFNHKPCPESNASVLEFDFDGEDVGEDFHTRNYGSINMPAISPLAGPRTPTTYPTSPILNPLDLWNTTLTAKLNSRMIANVRRAAENLADKLIPDPDQPQSELKMPDDHEKHSAEQHTTTSGQDRVVDAATVNNFAKALPSSNVAILNSSSTTTSDLSTRSKDKMQDDLTQSVQDNSAELTANDACNCPFQPTAGIADSYSDSHHDPQRSQCQELAINPTTNPRVEAKVDVDSAELKESEYLKSFAEQLVESKHQASQALLAHITDTSEYDRTQFQKTHEREEAFNSQFLKKAEEVHEKIKTLSSNPKKGAPMLQASQTLTSTEREDDLNNGNGQEGSWKDDVLPIALIIGLVAGCVVSLGYLHHSRKEMVTTRPLRVLRAVSSTDTKDMPLVF